MLFNAAGIVFQTCQSDMDFVLQLLWINTMTATTANQINSTQLTCWNLTCGPFFYSHAYSPPNHLAALTARGPHSLITALPSSSCTATCVFPVDRLCSEATSHTHYIPSKWKPMIVLSSTATIYYQRPKNSHHKDALPQTPPQAKLGNYLSIMLDTSKIQASASTMFFSRKLPLDLSKE